MDQAALPLPVRVALEAVFDAAHQKILRRTYTACGKSEKEDNRSVGLYGRAARVATAEARAEKSWRPRRKPTINLDLIRCYNTWWRAGSPIRGVQPVLSVECCSKLVLCADDYYLCRQS